MITVGDRAPRILVAALDDNRKLGHNTEYLEHWRLRCSGWQEAPRDTVALDSIARDVQ